MASLKQKITAGIAGLALAFQLASGITYSAPRETSPIPITARTKQEALQKYDNRKTVEQVYRHFNSKDANLVLQYLDCMNDRKTNGFVVDGNFYDGHLDSYIEEEFKGIVGRLKSAPLEQRLKYNSRYNVVMTENNNLLVQEFGLIGALEELRSPDKQVSLDGILSKIKTGEIIYAGVDHYDNEAFKVIGEMVKKLTKKGHSVNIFYEGSCPKMQDALDQFFSHKISKKEFKKKMLKANYGKNVLEEFFFGREYPLFKTVLGANKNGPRVRVVGISCDEEADASKVDHTFDVDDYYERDRFMAKTMGKYGNKDKINLVVVGGVHTYQGALLPQGKIIIFSSKRTVDAHNSMKQALLEGQFKNPEDSFSEAEARKGYGIGDIETTEKVKATIDYYYNKSFYSIK